MTALLVTTQDAKRAVKRGQRSALRRKDVLGDFQTDYDNFRHGRLPQVVLNTSTLAHRCRRGRPPHHKSATNRAAKWPSAASLSRLVPRLAVVSSFSLEPFFWRFLLGGLFPPLC
jgi:hypothetical protein